MPHEHEIHLLSNEFNKIEQREKYYIHLASKKVIRDNYKLGDQLKITKHNSPFNQYEAIDSIYVTIKDITDDGYGRSKISIENNEYV
jgi:hypothetical protein